jgi:hypothetical protein
MPEKAKKEKRVAVGREVDNAPSTVALREARALAEEAARKNDPAKFGVEGCCPRQFWAVVESDGSLARGRNVVRTVRLGEGRYAVVFTANVSKGAFVATLGPSGIGTAPTGQIGVATRCCTDSASYLPFELLGAPGANEHAVWVDTHDTNGTYSDRPFHLVVLTH